MVKKQIKKSKKGSNIDLFNLFAGVGGGALAGATVGYFLLKQAQDQQSKDKEQQFMGATKILGYDDTVVSYDGTSVIGTIFNMKTLEIPAGSWSGFIIVETNFYIQTINRDARNHWMMFSLRAGDNPDGRFNPGYELIYAESGPIAQTDNSSMIVVLRAPDVDPSRTLYISICAEKTWIPPVDNNYAIGNYTMIAYGV